MPEKPCATERTPSAGLRAWSAIVAMLGAIYVAVLITGLASAPPGAPVQDPWFSALELLILTLAPSSLAMAAEILAASPPSGRPSAILGFAFIGGCSVLTCIVHFTILVLSRTVEFGGAPWEVVFSFRWPSVAYALDILAWDGFFALGLLCLAPAMRDPLVRGLLRLASALALVGLLGPVLGDMAVRNIGIIGYAIVFPVAAALNAMRRSDRMRASRPA